MPAVEPGLKERPAGTNASDRAPQRGLPRTRSGSDRRNRGVTSPPGPFLRHSPSAFDSGIVRSMTMAPACHETLPSGDTPLPNRAGMSIQESASCRGRCRGFTLLEVVAAVAVAVILMGVAATSYMSVVDGQRIEAAKRDIVNVELLIEHYHTDHFRTAAEPAGRASRHCAAGGEHPSARCDADHWRGPRRTTRCISLLPRKPV